MCPVRTRTKDEERRMGKVRAAREISEIKRVRCEIGSGERRERDEKKESRLAIKEG